MFLLDHEPSMKLHHPKGDAPGGFLSPPKPCLYLSKGPRWWPRPQVHRPIGGAPGCFASPMPCTPSNGLMKGLTSYIWRDDLLQDLHHPIGNQIGTSNYEAFQFFTIPLGGAPGCFTSPSTTVCSPNCPCKLRCMFCADFISVKQNYPSILESRQKHTNGWEVLAFQMQKLLAW